MRALQPLLTKMLERHIFFLLFDFDKPLYGFDVEFQKLMKTFVFVNNYLQYKFFWDHLGTELPKIY